MDGNDIRTIGNPIKMNDGSFTMPAPAAASASSDAASSSHTAPSNGHSAVAVKRPADPVRTMDKPRPKVAPRTGSSGGLFLFSSFGQQTFVSKILSKFCCLCLL